MAEEGAEKTCRICLAEDDPEMGRLVSSMSYVHVKCLQRWRNTSASRSAFFSCPQCKYQYRFARTQIVGIATNPVVVGAISAILFTLLVLLSSFVTTYFMSWFEEPSDTFYYRPGYYSSFWSSPVDVARDIIRAALRVLQDQDGKDGPIFGRGDAQSGTPAPHSEPGFLQSFIRRFLLGLPMIGAGSIVHMLLSLPFISPVHYLARYRSSSRRKESSRDIISLIIIGLVLVGAARALVKVYYFTQSTAKRILHRAEDAILEVN
ncbi:hypothetical protein C8F04DRAFT_951426 [Mycena alexandri]|uniref:RING-CH-type domain-containing protein n=1 Tax=Mycena alexandri TaxID=1745969 RepID=A0AAD6T2K8_9AGAR|nr:hypothetical protein C8F04DRAFT_951426 [Mycena alexandri]